MDELYINFIFFFEVLVFIFIEEEFVDLLGYIVRIKFIVEKVGICKIKLLLVCYLFVFLL